MKLLFAILALVALCQGIPTSFIGSRIINGRDAEEGEFPYQVSLQLRDDGFHFCGGSILNENYVVTAAHCVAQDSRYTMQVVAGTLNLLYPQVTHYVDKIIVHQGYDPTHSFVNDIALLKMEKPFVFSSTLSPVPLPAKAAKPKVGEVAVVSGWGTLWLGGPSPDVLQTTEVAIAYQEYCNRVNSAVGLPVYEHQICAYNVFDRTGPCHGDSGGPLTVDGKLVGVTSWVVSCASSTYPTVYTRVADYIDWLHDHAV